MRERLIQFTGWRDRADAQSGVRLVAVGLLLAATLLLYNPVVHHDFINLDDPYYVAENPHVRSGLKVENVIWAFTHFRSSNWHPLTWVSHMADSQLFGLKPAGHHYSNVLIHAVNVFLLFLLLRRATGHTWRSLVVAALFAVHPLNVENVAWVAERKSLLSAFFSFLCLAAYGWYARRPGWKGWKRYLVVVAAFALALMCKPMAVTLPIVLLIVDYWPLERLRGSIFRARSLWLVAEKAPLFAMTAVGCWLTMAVQGAGGSVSHHLSLSVRLRNALFSTVQYIYKTVWPANLSIFYVHPGNTLSWRTVLLAGTLLAAILAATLVWRQRRYLLAGWLVFLITLVPVIGIVQVGLQGMADRYAYLPCIGLFLAAVWGLADLADRWSIGWQWRAFVAVIVVGCLAAATGLALTYWQNSVVLFSRAREVNRGSGTWEHALPKLEDLTGEGGRIGPDRASSVPAFGQPGWEDTRITAFGQALVESSLADALNTAGRLDEAFEHFKLAIALAPEEGIAHFNLGTFLLHQGKFQEAVPQLHLALRFSTQTVLSVHALNNLGIVYLQLGDYDASVNCFTQLLQLDQGNSRPLLGRGQAHYGAARFQQAADDFSRMLQFDADPVAFFWLGRTLEKQGNNKDALSAYRQALKGNAELREARIRVDALEGQLRDAAPVSRPDVQGASPFSAPVGIGPEFTSN